MPILTNKLDPNGRAIATVFVSVSEARSVQLVKEKKMPPPPLQLKALIDTGSTGMAIDSKYISSLKLPPRGFYTARKGDGSPSYHALYEAGLRILMNPGESDLFITEIQCAARTHLVAEHDVDVLIGQDVLSLLHFSQASGSFTLEYKLPPSIAAIAATPSKELVLEPPSPNEIARSQVGESK